MDLLENPRDDDSIIDGLKNKESEAYRWLVDMYSIRMLRFICFKKPQLQLQDAEEIVSDALHGAMEKISEFKVNKRSKNSFRNWLFTIALNKARDRLRQLHAQATTLEYDDAVLIVSVEHPNDPDPPAHPERIAAVNRVLEQMSSERRTLLFLCIGRGIEPHDLSKHMRKSSGAIRTQLLRARNEFRERILKEPEFADWSDS